MQKPLLTIQAVSEAITQVAQHDDGSSQDRKVYNQGKGVLGGAVTISQSIFEPASHASTVS